MQWVVYSTTLLGGYLLGSLPTGYLVGRARGVDLRLAGSGNIGATNAFRILGKWAGILVLIVDALKGFLACHLGANGTYAWLAKPDIAAREYLAIGGGVAAILGHTFSCWLRFRGGKGIATTAGVLIALMPLASLLVVGIWLGVLLIGRYVSLASIVAAFSLPWIVWGLNGSSVLIWMTGAISVLAIYKHKTNIQRLLRGTEHRLLWGKKEPH